MTSLVIDIGSSSIRALLYDENLTPIPGALTQRLYQFTVSPDESAQASVSTADAVYLRTLTEACIDELLQHPAAQTIRAVGVATFVGNLVGLDKLGKPITPVYTYADNQSLAQAKHFYETLDHDAVHERTGCPIHTAYHPARLAWLQTEHPALFERVQQWCDLATYLYQTWFERDVPCSYSIASWAGMLNRHTLTWDAAWLDELGMTAAQFPRLADYSDLQHGLSAIYSVRWPYLVDVPFFLAVGDGAAANIGSGGTSPAYPVLTVGTTAALRVVTDAPMSNLPYGLWSYRVDSAHHLIGGATTEGGNLYQWALKTLNLEIGTLEAALSHRKPDAHGLTVLPFWAGERSPGWRFGSTGQILGLRLSTSPLDIVQAMLESVAYRLRLILDLLPAMEDAPLLVGGGSMTRSPAWAQIIADILERPLHLLREDEVTARGLALLIAGKIDKDDQRPIPAQIISPRQEHFVTYRAALQRHINADQVFAYHSPL